MIDKKEVDELLKTSQLGMSFSDKRKLAKVKKLQKKLKRRVKWQEKNR